MHGSEFLWSTAMGCNFSFILVPSWVNFSNRYMYGWSKIVHRRTWMGLTSYTVVHGWVTFPSKLVHWWVMGGGTSKFPEAHLYPDQSWVPPRVLDCVWKLKVDSLVFNLFLIALVYCVYFGHFNKLLWKCTFTARFNSLHMKHCPLLRTC